MIEQGEASPVCKSPGLSGRPHSGRIDVDFPDVRARFGGSLQARKQDVAIWRPAEIPQSWIRKDDACGAASELPTFDQGFIVSTMGAQGGDPVSIGRPRNTPDRVSFYARHDPACILSVRSHLPDLASAADEGNMRPIGRGHGIVGAIPKKPEVPASD